MHPKMDDFLEEKAKSHGNADAYRGFLTHYYGKSAVFGQFLTMAHTRRLVFCPYK